LREKKEKKNPLKTYMTDAFTIKNYSILTSLNKTQIYLKMMDTVTHLTYESNLDVNDLRLSTTLEDTYKIITNCFAEDAGYKVAISVKSGLMKLKFNALVGGFLKLDFDVFLKEKLMSNDAQLTLFMNQLEQRQESVVETLTKRCNELASVIADQETRFNHLETLLNTVSCAEIDLRLNAFFPINVQTLTIQGDAHLKVDKMSSLYKLQKIVFTSFSFVDLSSFKNGSLREMTIESSSKLTGLKGLDGFPHLEVLTISAAPLLKDFSALYKFCGKLKTLKMNGPTDASIQRFCNEHKISLQTI
jgi:hypothetical protein